MHPMVLHADLPNKLHGALFMAHSVYDSDKISVVVVEFFNDAILGRMNNLSMMIPPIATMQLYFSVPC